MPGQEDYLTSDNWENEIRSSIQAYEDSGLRVAFAVEMADQNSFVYEDDQKFIGSLESAVR